MYMKIYSRCPQCGIEGLKIRQILRQYPDAEVIKTNTKQLIEEQRSLMKKGGFIGYAIGLIVENGEIRSLRDWKP